MKDLFEVLKSRGLIEWTSNEFILQKLLKDNSNLVYCGIDPTGDSLHIGHLIPLITLKWFQKYGFKVIPLIGGATGLIGDPSGKSKERNLLDTQTIIKNINKIETQLSSLLNQDNSLILNNYNWISKLTFLDILRDIGKHFSINNMISREYVKSRLEDINKGISYTEFSYVLLQAYDFYYLNKTYNCNIQIGGNDQQGNILAGIDYIKKVDNTKNIVGFTQPLLLNSNGTKFGKTENGENIWLDKYKTSPYKFYQFWFNRSDNEVERLLKLYTFIELDKIEELMHTNLEDRLPQRTLARELVKLIYDENILSGIEKVNKVLFNKDIDNIYGVLNANNNIDLINILSQELKTLHYLFEGFKSKNIEYDIIDFLIRNDIFKSRSQVKKSINSIYIDNKRLNDIDELNQLESKLGYHLIRKGKKDNYLINIYERK